MKIHALMIPDPITTTENASISDAIELMKINSIRHLPVVSEGHLPSLLGDISLSDLMIKDPIVIDPDSDIETAARLIYKHKISGIPVVKNNQLVGIITETDILRAFIDMMGLLTASSRIDVIIGDQPGAFRAALQIINDNGGDVISVGMTGQEASKRAYYFRLTSCKTDVIRRALEKEGFEVLNAMD